MISFKDDSQESLVKKIRTKLKKLILKKELEYAVKKQKLTENEQEALIKKLLHKHAIPLEKHKEFIAYIQKEIE